MSSCCTLAWLRKSCSVLSPGKMWEMSCQTETGALLYLMLHAHRVSTSVPSLRRSCLCWEVCVRVLRVHLELYLTCMTGRCVTCTHTVYGISELAESGVFLSQCLQSILCIWFLHIVSIIWDISACFFFFTRSLIFIMPRGVISCQYVMPPVNLLTPAGKTNKSPYECYCCFQAWFQRSEKTEVHYFACICMENCWLCRLSWLSFLHAANENLTRI